MAYHYYCQFLSNPNYQENRLFKASSSSVIGICTCIDLAPGMNCLQHNLKNIQMVKSSGRLKSTIFYQRARRQVMHLRFRGDESVPHEISS